MIYHSIEDIKNLAEEKQVPMWRIIMEKDMEERQVTEGETFEAMRAMYLAMKQADQSYNGALSSPSGLAGGDGEKNWKVHGGVSCPGGSGVSDCA